MRMCLPVVKHTNESDRSILCFYVFIKQKPDYKCQMYSDEELQSSSGTKLHQVPTVKSAVYLKVNKSGLRSNESVKYYYLFY